MNAHSERLGELARWLEACRPLWAERPFVGLPLSWERAHPEVAEALRGLPLSVIDEVEPRPWALADQMPAAFRGWVDEAARWSLLPALEATPVASLEARPPRVSERKWRQVRPFLEATLAATPEGVTRWLEWCSGKGHLGRSMAMVTGKSVVCVERDRQLCHQGDQEAIAVGAEARFLQADLLSADLGAELGPGTCVLALHACGRLHRELVRQAAEGGASMIALAPCCYHRFLEGGHYRPLSDAGRQSGFALEPGQLKLVGLSETVATPRRQGLRRREQRFRLGTDLLLREVTGEDRYRPLGAVPRAWVEQSFEAFSRRLAGRAGVTLPESGWDPIEYETLGEERLRLVRALGLVRGLFRRPLEVWLLTDLTQHLIERGWQARLGTFCPPAVTPRNAMILAWR